MDGGAWWATVHGVAMSRTRLSDFTFFLFFVIFLALGSNLPCVDRREGGPESFVGSLRPS